jgi:putative endonuclease
LVQSICLTSRGSLVRIQQFPHNKEVVSNEQPLFVLMYYTYIIYSPSLNKYYIGSTGNPELRLYQHNTGFFKNSFTCRSNDWELASLFPCKDSSQARRLELYIKDKKSRKFVEKLIAQPNLFRKYLI